MKTFKVRRSNLILFLVLFIPALLGTVLRILTMIGEGRDVAFRDKWIIGFVIGCGIFIFYCIIWAFQLRVKVDEEGIGINKPPLDWRDANKFSLKWNEIECLEAKFSPLFLEITQYILRPKKGTGKKSIRFTTMIENFQELVEILLQRIPTEDDIKKEIQWQVKRVTRKWPLGPIWTFVLILIFIFVAIHFTFTFLNWPH